MSKTSLNINENHRETIKQTPNKTGNTLSIRIQIKPLQRIIQTHTKSLKTPSTLQKCKKTKAAVFPL